MILPPRMRNGEDLDSDRFSIVTSGTFETTETESSATTVWGPGTLSGRAIKSLGEASLRGVEKLLVRWRLAKIDTILSVSKNPAEPLEKVYDDLLELSSSAVTHLTLVDLTFYDIKVRQKALKLIMMQIGSRETNQLLICIVKWPREEIIVFLSEMMPCIPLLWHNTDTGSILDAEMKARLELIAVYRSSLLPSEPHEILPFLDLMFQLAQEHESSCRAVIESGFLDTLVVICEQCTFDESPIVVTTVQQIIEKFCQCQRGWDVLRAPQRLDLVWPRVDPVIPLSQISLAMTFKTPNLRKQSWLASSSKAIIHRLCEIAVILSMPELRLKIDLDIKDANFTELSMSYISQIIALGGEIRLALEHVLSKVDFFYRIVHPLSRLQIERLPTAVKFCWAVKARHPEADPVDFFIQFAVDIAENSQDNAQAINDAELKSLIIANRGGTPNIKHVLQRLQTAIGQQQQPNTLSNRPRAGTV
ncbi:hypothetical protein BDP27DRAFT_1311018 [Rhodocollybia butyracea]|uniref:Uncharacterized protein n=1 Tax=Rhodocollybia butyracea TaxID=206335 RepID=A0A9P5QA71_9AGAR|nr:hypothetical protein BDP27DRAFT_1311018 [Rhodocollybia butyracea]